MLIDTREDKATIEMMKVNSDSIGISARKPVRTGKSIERFPRDPYRPTVALILCCKVVN